MKDLDVLEVYLELAEAIWNHQKLQSLFAIVYKYNVFGYRIRTDEGKRLHELLSDETVVISDLQVDISKAIHALPLYFVPESFELFDLKVEDACTSAREYNQKVIAEIEKYEKDRHIFCDDDPVFWLKY